jgi:hypothetical protein
VVARLLGADCVRSAMGSGRVGASVPIGWLGVATAAALGSG